MSQLQEYLLEEFVEKDKTKLNIQDDIFKSIKEGWDKKLGYVPERPMALVTITDPDEPNVLKSIGCSEPNDLILDNFGVVFAGQFNNNVNTLRNLVDEFGNTKTFRVGGTTPVNYCGTQNIGTPFSAGMRMLIGSNSSAGGVARSDFDLNDRFVAAPEALPFGVTPGGWISGNQQVVVEGVINNVTTNDSIGEAGLQAFWNDTAAVGNNILICHDICGGAFLSGQNVNLTYTWSIT